MPNYSDQCMEPRVSCILATTGRRKPFLRQAIKYFQRQTYKNKELLIVDDDSDSAAHLVSGDDRIRYIGLDTGTNLGAKLNVGIEQARGDVIQKLDDDDYYAPEFLSTTVNSLMAHEPERSVVGLECFLVLIAATGELKYSGDGWCAGGTLCFFRQLWEKRAFRDLPRFVDYSFLKDHSPTRIKIKDPELYILVRHDIGHLWTRLGNTDVTEHFRRRRTYHKSLSEILPDDDLAFYESLRTL